MDPGKDREIIGRSNHLRLLEKEGRETTAVRRLIEEAIVRCEARNTEASPTPERRKTGDLGLAAFD
jgi:hypothetical protein